MHGFFLYFPSFLAILRYWAGGGLDKIIDIDYNMDRTNEREAYLLSRIWERWWGRLSRSLATVGELLAVEGKLFS
jgi:hypothetical protein